MHARALLTVILGGIAGLWGCTREAESGFSPDAGRPAPSACQDGDRDGYGEGPDCRGIDCDDADNTVHPGAPELCDGVDNDCNGAVDDNLIGPDCALTRGVCAGSRRRCVDGIWAVCAGVSSYGEAFESDEASCDAQDNDCDGFVDEECPCNPGSSQPCGQAEGECRQGIQQCVEGSWGACEGEVGPADEACNGRDDDCDGQLDEGLDALRPDCRLTAGVCAGARQRCVGQTWATCGAAEYGERYVAEEGPAHCDGADNDCDGAVDEACGCQDGDEQPCGLAVGACRPGSQTCVEGRWGACRGAVEPHEERCDGLDNDCDGNVDETLVAPACALSLGICAGAVERCAGEAGWEGCTPATYAEHDERFVAAETAAHCDRVDNDCDGAVDEACGCEAGQVQACGANVGQCTQGEQRCVDGRWGPCSGQGPSDEACDGRDNDCDGTTDEGVMGPVCPLQDGVCAGIRQRCVEGVLRACTPEDYGPRYRADEQACDQLDNDCDGQTDEGCGCEAGAVQPCGTDVGQCQRGSQTCVAGRWSACDGAIEPAMEACDGTDNDCDGQSDEDLSAPPCALQRGVCAGKVQACGGAGGFGACGPAQYGPQYVAAETDAHCDGRDNDCDGEIDEACDCQPGGDRPVCGSAIGACHTGLLVCEGGRFGACEGEVPPEAEDCNGLDDDCDGTTDEDVQAPACALQAGVCAGTRRQCAGGAGFVDCREDVYGRNYREEETDLHCDGLDNDCDGRTDERCAAPTVRISEIRVAGPGEDGEVAFIELSGPPGQRLNGMRLEAINGSNGRSYRTLDLAGGQIPANGWYLIVEAGTENTPGATGVLRDIADRVVRGADLQNGPDSLQLFWNDQLIDAVAYGRFGAGETAAGEGMPAPAPGDRQSLSRDAASTDTDDNARDFSLLDVPTPGGGPLPRLHIALRWDTDGTDFDLHLLRGVFGSADDCHWALRTPPWGPNGEIGDPRLVQDDQDGFGPEFIDYVAPRPDPEGYVVLAHYFSGELGGAEPSEAEVLIFIDGELAVPPFVRRIDRLESYWAVALIEAPADGSLRVEPLDLVGNQPLEP
ncbi:MAG: MopE-related protein [bacterium]